MELSDYEVIQLCLRGNQDAYSELIKRYQKLIYTIIYRLINNREEASDISQDVFLKIYRSLDKYNPEYKFSTWAVKIATNLCLDILRKKKVDTIPVEEMIYEPGNIESPEEKYLKEEQKKQIDDAINTLPMKYKLPVILFHYQGLSYDEICKVMNEPLSIVKNRLHRARHMLRDRLSYTRREEAL